MTEPLSLPAREQQLYDLLAGKGDVGIDSLFEAMQGPDSCGLGPLRQRWLGPYVTKLNRRLRNLRMKVVPGEARRSYRLQIQ